ncbi:PREDICTED: E3 ubiquitin-protein ligase HUWE1-like [Thamnophis sirtalis]|uniref:E3 ubiquitin-protein ligase HUWE1-like n=1 Tax=Thamnophis sirtalis TaxID=35019 RepID=A0A6I9XTR8_9SAUR|nr:PREDICTED: E3 ubiquitin-protein ligase HUWE1-like [Thamnophis sirtalis]
MVYLDDILIYMETCKEHVKLVRSVLKKLRAVELYAKLCKCEFHQEKIDYLGYHISHDGIKMDPAKQDNWVEFLPHAEVAYNNSVHSSTGFTPFKIVFGHDFVPIPEVPREKPQVLSLSEWSDQLRKIWPLAYRVLDAAHRAPKNQTDKKRTKPKEYKIGDRVFLSTKFLQTTQKSKKLGPKYVGPFPIVENELEDLIDELLEQDGGSGNSTIIVGRSGEDESQEDVLMDEAPSNLSQASTLQANREDSMNILDPEDEEEHTQEEDSSGSNEDEDDSQDEEEEEEEEDEDDQDDEEGEEGEEEEDDDDGSEMELDEDYPDMNASPLVRFERFDREDDLIIEFDNMFSSATDIPPSPGNIPATHPLMVRHADHSSLTLGSGSSTTRLAQGIGRSQRTLRQLTANTGHTIHVHYPGTRQPNPPLILQRLLGPSAAADILQLSSSLPLQSRGRARLLVGNDDVHIIARSDDELLDEFFHDQSTATSQAGTLSSIPTALTRWTEECKVLDAESMHDCVSVVKVPIINHLEALRDEELEERREKRRKQLAEEEAKVSDKAKDSEDKEQNPQGPVPQSNSSAEQNLPDGATHPDGYPAVSAAAKDTSAGSKQTLVTLESPQQQQQQQATGAGELPSELVGQSTAQASGQLLMPVEQEDSGPGRLSTDAEATQMELSPAPTITSLSPERAEDSDALTAVSSQLEGSPMDTSSLASCNLEESVAESGGASTVEQAGTDAVVAAADASQQGPNAHTAREGQPDPSQQVDDGSPPASSESSSTRDSAVAISGADSRGILEEPLPSTSSEEEDPLAGINLPEGVDPSFLAALPDDIRREVLQNQLGIRPPARSAPTTTATTPTPPVVGNPGVTEVSPEFLAALPPAIQEEVLAQQRAEQQRRELAQSTSSDTPMDPVTFIQTLPSDLRRSVLEDMEDSVLAVMPPDIAAEAQALRREQEARQRQLMHERLFGHSSTSALSAILRSPAFTSRLSGNRGVQYTRLAVQRGGTFQMGGSSSHSRPSGSNVDSLLRLRGRLLLDHEALSCLLVLLFVDEPKLNTSRLHRVLRNLCYHAQTRNWVIRSLLSILQRSSESELCVETPKGTVAPDDKGKRAAKGCGADSRPLDLLHKMESKSSGQLSWLSVSMDAALGCRTNIFQIQRAGGRKHTEKHAAAGSTVHIHPQAAPVVCRHVLDTLIQLAKVKTLVCFSSLQSESNQAEGSVRRDESPMDVDQPSPTTQDTQSVVLEGAQQGEKEKEERPPDLPLLSEQLSLDELWDMLGECLKELEESHDQHAVLVLQPAVEAFFLVHATERESKPPVRDTRESQLAHIKDEPPPLSPAPLTPATPSSLDPFFSREPSSMHISSSLPPDTQKFLRFAETHRTVLNQILRQSTTHLADGPFAVLVDYIRVLDFDVKRKYFRQELERLDEGLRKEDMAVHVRRDHVFEDSYRELHRKSPEEMKNRLYIVFEGEEGQDAGGLLREWYMIISREMFNPMYALFRTSPGDRVTYTINPSSHCNPNHLSYFKFVGRIVAKAVYDNRLLECYFTRSFYKHILGKSVRYTDMESEDYHFYQGLVYLLENDVSTLGYDLTFSTEVQEFGVCEVRDLKPNGANILVTEENKKEYVHLVCQMRMTGAIRKQLAAFLEGFYEIIPKRLISIFTEQELELLISGLPTIDIDDLKSNTEYHKYQANSIQIQWFWRALRSFDQADRAKFLQFVTGTSKVPLQGFAALEGMNGIQKFQIHRDDRSTDRLPSAHTCFNQLDLPAYESYEKLRHMLLLAIQECSEGFGLA